MKRGTITKQETDTTLVLERKMITRRYVLKLDREKCIGCQICPAACPQEAIDLRPGIVENGSLVQRPAIDIDTARCNFCGECVVLCPVNALSLAVNDQPEIPVLQYEAFPELVKEISVNGAELSPDAVAACGDCCPTEVIAVEAERDATGQVTRVLGVEVDEAGCIYCRQCEVAYPGVFTVTKPWTGRVILNVARCPENCRACVDVCPTDALQMVDDTLILDERFCLYCGACQVVCPVEEALTVERARILHRLVTSAAWTAALEKLISPQAAALELDAKSQNKRRQVLSFMPGVGEAE